MRRKVVSVWLAMVLLFGLLVVLDISIDITPRVGATTWYVDDVPGGSPPEDFTSIQDAVDAASDGDTIYVYSGIYYEHVDVGYKSITLTGENRDTTIINGGGVGRIIDIPGTSPSGVIIEKFTITDAVSGIISYDWYNIIRNNRVQNMTSDGIGVYQLYNLVFNNIITDCGTGIGTLAANTIKSNVINNCDWGVYFLDSYNFIYNNQINVNIIGLHFDHPYHSRNTISQNNTVNGETVYYFNNIHGTPTSPIVLNNLILDNANISSAGKISLVDCSNFLINKNTLSNNYPGSGIFIYSSENISIEENLIDNNTGQLFVYDGSGIQIFGSNNITISQNNIFNNHEGIYCEISSDFPLKDEYNANINIRNNSFYCNSGNGILLSAKVHFGEIVNNSILNSSVGIYFDSWSGAENVRYFNVANNTLDGNSVGMQLRYAWNNTIRDNTISSCGVSGVKSRYYSRYNVFSNNTIDSYGYGFEYDRDSYNTYVNNTISGGTYDLYFSGSSPSYVTLLNCSFNKSKVHYSSPDSTLTVKWYLHTNVTNSLTQPISNAIICIKDDHYSLPTYKYKTDSEGYVRWLTQTEYIEQDTNGDTIGEKSYYTPHRITAWNETLMGYAEVNINESKEVNIVLDTPYYEIPLSAGWNLISLPLVQLDTDISTVLSSILGNYDIVQWYNASDGKWHSTNDDLTNINHTMGFWIHMKTPDTLIVTGSIPNTTSIQLYQGWNLVGNPSFCIHAIDDILSPIATKYTVIQQYDSWDSGDPWKHYNINKPQNLNDLDYMTSGRGYWLYVTEDVVWEVSNF